ncbi:MAG: tyrosine-type recombinase/integrase [Chloroflexota bacterium]
MDLEAAIKNLTPQQKHALETVLQWVDNGNGTVAPKLEKPQENLRRLCANLGIKPVTLHQLRHWWATRTLQNSGKLDVVSRLLGHSSVGITGDIYRHVSQDEMQATHARFSSLDSIAGGGSHNKLT